MSPLQISRLFTLCSLTLLTCTGCLRDSGDTVEREPMVDMLLDMEPEPVMDQDLDRYTDERCAQEDACSEAGLCVASADGSRCTVTSDSCAQSAGCQAEGLCSASLDQSRCVTSDEGCLQSQACLDTGRCASGERGGACLLSQSGCAQLSACTEEGRCAVSESGEECVFSEEGCVASQVCSTSGRCGLSADVGACVSTTEGCAQQEACAQEGRCRASEDGLSCLLSDEGCAQLGDCVELGRCGASEDGLSCVYTNAGCSALSACEREGRCGASEDLSSCVVTTAGCLALSACASEGRCGASEDLSSCVVTTAGCARSEGCRESGLCGYSERGESCVATSEGCAQSTACEELDLCVLSEEGGTCGALSRVGLGDTAPLSCNGDYCPASRLSSLEFSNSAAQTEEWGCQLTGDGTSLSNILSLSGSSSLTELLSPDETGQIPLLLLAHFEGWSMGATGNEAGPVTMSWYQGVQVDGGYYIDSQALGPMGEAQSSFPLSTITDGLLVTPESNFNLGFQATLIGPLRLKYTTLITDLSVAQGGAMLTNGTLSGYITRDGLIESLEELYALCGIGQEPIGTPPDYCDTLGGFVTGDPESDVALFATFFSFDTIIDDTGRAPCEGGDCNAVSVCARFEMEPVELLGLTP